MLAYEEAKSRAHDFINSMVDLGTEDEIMILDEASEENSKAFVFRYDSRLYIETGNPLYMLPVDFPVMVSKANGECQLQRG